MDGEAIILNRLLWLHSLPNMHSITSTPELSPCTSPNLTESLPTKCFQSNPHLLALPAELHQLILPHLTYPDLLALKHSHPYFYNIVTTTVPHRLNWLIERAKQGLPLPQKTCRWKTDADFCGSAEVREFMERRRWHMDCPIDFGVRKCLVIEGSRCPGPRVGRQGTWRGMSVADVVFRNNGAGQQLEFLKNMTALTRYRPLVTAAIVLIFAVVVFFSQDQQSTVPACLVSVS